MEYLSTTITNMSRKSSQQNLGAFGAWLRSQILSHGWTQSEFADLIGVPQGTVSRWINGQTPKGSYIDRIADGLLIDFDTVAERAGIRPPDIHVDPESPEGQLVPMVRKVVWTEDRLNYIKASLRSMIDVDETNRKKKDQR